MLPLCRGLLDAFEPLNFQLRLWLQAKSLLLVFTSLSTPIMQTRGDQCSSDHRHRLKHSSRTKGLMCTKDRRWGNWKEWESKQEKLSFHSWGLLPADNSGTSDLCSDFLFPGTTTAERLPLEIALTDGHSLDQPWLEKSPGQQQREGWEKDHGCSAEPGWRINNQHGFLLDLSFINDALCNQDCRCITCLPPVRKE